jgi:hypothetical protein
MCDFNKGLDKVKGGGGVIWERPRRPGYDDTAFEFLLAWNREYVGKVMYSMVQTKVPKIAELMGKPKCGKSCSPQQAVMRFQSVGLSTLSNVDIQGFQLSSTWAKCQSLVAAGWNANIPQQLGGLGLASPAHKYSKYESRLMTAAYRILMNKSEYMNNGKPKRRVLKAVLKERPSFFSGIWKVHEIENGWENQESYFSKDIEISAPTLKFGYHHNWVPLKEVEVEVSRRNFGLDNFKEYLHMATQRQKVKEHTFQKKAYACLSTLYRTFKTTHAHKSIVSMITRSQVMVQPRTLHKLLGKSTAVSRHAKNDRETGNLLFFKRIRDLSGTESSS